MHFLPRSFSVSLRSCLLGWLAAIGATGFIAGVMSAAAVFISAPNTIPNVADTPGSTDATTGLVTGIAVLILLFLVYLFGGTIAGVKAQRSGAMHGAVVWFLTTSTFLSLAELGAATGPGSESGGFLSSTVSVLRDKVGTTMVVGMACAVTLAGAVIGGRLAVGRKPQ